jgi:hypothetical protein
MFKAAFKFGFSAIALCLSMSTQAISIHSEDLRWGGSESNEVQLFNEVQNQHINDDSILVDYLIGTNLSVGDQFTGLNNSRSGLFLKEGHYSSYLLHFDTPGNTSGSIRNDRFQFNDNIVAIILGGEYLKLSDVMLGISGTQYEQSISRRMETHDLFTLESSNTLLINKMSIGASWIDEARVITHKVSEPASWALFACGLLGLIGARKLNTHK